MAKSITFKQWLQPLLDELEVETDKWRDKNINKKAQVVILTRGALLSEDSNGETVLTADTSTTAAANKAMKEVKQVAREWIKNTRPGKDTFAKDVKTLNIRNAANNRFHYVVVKDWNQSRSLFNKFKQAGLMKKGAGTHRGHEKSAVSLQGDTAIKKLGDTTTAGAFDEGTRGKNEAYKASQSLRAELQRESNKLTPSLKASSKNFIHLETSGLKGELVLLLPETKASNLGDKQSLETGHRQRLLKIVERYVEKYGDEIVNIEGSKTLMGALSGKLDDAIRGKKGKKYNTSKSINYKGKKAKRVKPPKIAIVTPPRIRDIKGRFTSAASIQQLIQAQITAQVKDNMGEGGSLVNRTGRFAESVTVTNVTQTRQGSLTAFYNYMKYPYQTFERGFKQGSTRRDPRLLIHKSIREIAQKLVHNKLNIKTRRV